MNGDLDKLNTQQMTKALATTEKWIKEENKSYNSRKKALKDMYADIKGTDDKAVKAKEEINNQLQNLEADHEAKMDAYGKRYAKLRKRLLEDELKSTYPSMQEGVIKNVEKQMEALGLSYDELISKTTKASSKIQETNTLWAQTTKKSSEEQKLANSQWNGMVWDTKTIS